MFGLAWAVLERQRIRREAARRCICYVTRDKTRIARRACPRHRHELPALAAEPQGYVLSRLLAISLTQSERFTPQARIELKLFLDTYRPLTPAENELRPFRSLGLARLMPPLCRCVRK
jgi:hypothetical protein